MAGRRRRETSAGLGQDMRKLQANVTMWLATDRRNDQVDMQVSDGQSCMVSGLVRSPHKRSQRES